MKEINIWSLCKTCSSTWWQNVCPPFKALYQACPKSSRFHIARSFSLVICYLWLTFLVQLNISWLWKCNSFFHHTVVKYFFCHLQLCCDTFSAHFCHGVCTRKRKVDSKARRFQERCELQYFFFFAPRGTFAPRGSKNFWMFAWHATLWHKELRIYRQTFTVS